MTLRFSRCRSRVSSSAIPGRAPVPGGEPARPACERDERNPPAAAAARREQSSAGRASGVDPWMVLLVIAVALLTIEWLTYNRRVTI